MEITTYNLHGGSFPPSLGLLQTQVYSALVRSRRCYEIKQASVRGESAFLTFSAASLACDSRRPCGHANLNLASQRLPLGLSPEFNSSQMAPGRPPKMGRFGYLRHISLPILCDTAIDDPNCASAASFDTIFEDFGYSSGLPILPQNLCQNH